MKTLREEDVLRVVGSDAYAISFQTMGQYRSALIKAILALPDASPQGPVSEERESLAQWLTAIAKNEHNSSYWDHIQEAAALLRAPQQQAGIAGDVSAQLGALMKEQRGSRIVAGAYPDGNPNAGLPIASQQRQDAPQQQAEPVAVATVPNSLHGLRWTGVPFPAGSNLYAAPQQPGEPKVWRVVRTDTWGDRYWSYGPTQDKDPIPAATTPYIEFFYAAPPPDSEAVALLQKAYNELIVDEEGSPEYRLAANALVVEIRAYLSRKDQR